MNISDILKTLNDVNIDLILGKILPIWGSMTDDQKRQFILELVEAISRGAAEGAVKGSKQ